MHYPIVFLTAAALLLAGCDGGVNPIDGKKFLAGLEGPKVPTVHDAMLASAQDAEKQGNYKQAIQVYLQILEKKPDDAGILSALAECYRRSADNDRAIALYDQVLQKDGNNLAAKEGKALALMAKGDFDTPGKLLGEVMQADKTRWKTLNALGILFTTRNMQSEAQQYFKEALKHSPSNTSVMNNLGLSQALDRNYDSAVTTLLQASSLTSSTLDRKRIDMNLALVYAIAGKLEEARGVAANYYSGPALDNNMGLYAHLAKDNQLAKTYLNMALSESKTFYEKAWDNLQTIDGSADSAGDDGVKQVTKKLDGEVSSTAAGKPAAPEKQTAKSPAAKVEKPKKETKKEPKKEVKKEGIDAIVDASGEEAKKPENKQGK